MTTSTTVNDVPMAGKGVYNDNCGLQTAAMHRALALLFDDLSLPTPAPNTTFTAIDYGCSQGLNSIPPFTTLIQSYKTSTSTTSNPQPTTILFTDRPQNDFTALAQTISAHPWAPRTFPAMIPTSFYAPVVPPSTAHAAFSLAALHHLSTLPVKDPSHTPEQRQQLARAQSRADLQHFLRLRAAELVPGAPLMVSFVGRPDAEGEANYGPLVAAAKKALGGLVADGVLGGDVLGRFEVPVFERGVEDVRGVFSAAGEDGGDGEGVKGLWRLERLCCECVEHPAGEERRRRTLGKEEYARVVVEWVMAVIGGYLGKACWEAWGGGEEEGGKGDRGELERKIQEVVRLWKERTYETFLRESPDAEVRCWFVFVRLRRV